jgi:sugar phosphate isomerase/epimerase
MVSRRHFLGQCAGSAFAAFLGPRLATALSNASPDLHFPTQARERIAISSYSFREFISPSDGPASKSDSTRMEIKDFAAHVISKFNVNKIEPWSAHFRSLDPAYLAEIRSAVAKAHGAIVNIAVDGEHSPTSPDQGERDAAVGFSKQWIDAAVAVGSPSIRTNLPPAGKSPPDLERIVGCLQRVAEYAAAKNIVVNLENDNPLTEDPLFLVKVIQRVNSPYLHALPDFANSLTAFPEQHAYDGVDAMFKLAYCICHVKETETAPDGRAVHVDLAKTFGFMKQHGYKGYCSMEFDSAGEAYQGTADLIKETVRYLS